MPDSILGSPGLGYIRQWLIKHTRIIASLDLHSDTFQPRNGTQTSILILQKKSPEEIAFEEKRGIAPYNIFMAIVDKIGHDKRGNPLFKRDKHGNEIFVEVEREERLEKEETADGTATVKVASLERVKDDQTEIVPDVFAEWKKQEGISW